MPVSLTERLVVAVASSALFDLDESDGVFCERGEEAYRAYQREHEKTSSGQGVAFPLIRRLLSQNGPGAARRIETLGPC